MVVNPVMKLENIKEHKKSLMHSKFTKMHDAKQNPKDQPVTKILRDLNKCQTKRMKLLLHNAHALAKKEGPYSDLEWQCE